MASCERLSLIGHSQGATHVPCTALHQLSLSHAPFRATCRAACAPQTWRGLPRSLAPFDGPRTSSRRHSAVCETHPRALPVRHCLLNYPVISRISRYKYGSGCATKGVKGHAGLERKWTTDETCTDRPFTSPQHEHRHEGSTESAGCASR